MRGQYAEYLYYDGTMTPVVNTGVVVYLGNTLTLADLFDANNVALDNPLYTDQDGRFTFWADIGLYDIYVYGTKLAAITLDGVSGGIELTQSAVYSMVQLGKLTPFEPGAAPFQIQMQSGYNPAPQSTTINNGVWFGWNASRHTGDTGTVEGRRALTMGFEDNYYDSGGDNEFASEWYVEGWSPDGTTVSMSRPFYARGTQKDDGTDWWTILHDIGVGGVLGQFSVRSKLVTLFNVTSTAIYNQLPLQQTGTITINGGDILLDNSKYIRMENAAGVPVSLMVMNSSNQILFGDIFNQTGTYVYLRSGGVNTVSLDAAGNIELYGYTKQSVGTNVASATTIAPTGPIFHVTGTTAIATISLPTPSFTGSITIIPDAAFTTTTAGNIGIASTGVIGKALIMTYDGTKWYPSY